MMPSYAQLKKWAANSERAQQALAAYALCTLPTCKDEAWRCVPAPMIAWDAFAAQPAHDDISDSMPNLFAPHAHRPTELFIAACAQQRHVLYITQHNAHERIDLAQVRKQVPLFHVEEIFIIVESGVQATIHDESAESAAQTSMTSVHILIKPGAVVSFARHAAWHNALHEIRHTRITLEENAQLDYQLAISGGAYVKEWIDVACIGQGAQASIRGAYVCTDKRVVHIISSQQHHAAHTTSALAINGIVLDHGHAAYQGMVHIGQHAARADASQNNKNMLIGSQAQAHSVPSLEVLTHDVRCAHGSAVGQLDEELLYYMQARGIMRNDAQRLLLTAFLAEVIHDEALQSQLLARVA